MTLRVAGASIGLDRDLPRVGVDHHTVQLRGKKPTTRGAVSTTLVFSRRKGRRASLVVGELAPQSDKDAYERNRGTYHPHEHPELESLGVELGVLSVEFGHELGNYIGGSHVADPLYSNISDGLGNVGFAEGLVNRFVIGIYGLGHAAIVARL